jgi:hypothetical protein
MGTLSLGWPSASYVSDLVFDLARSHPEPVNARLAFATMCLIGVDGKVTSALSGNVLWAPNPPSQHTRNFGQASMAAPSAATVRIYIADALAKWEQPYCFELPQAILNIVAAEPAGAIAESYRRYIRTVLVPQVETVANLLTAHAAMIEWPPKEWLSKQFPGLNMNGLSSGLFGEQWVAYALSWSGVLADWNEVEKFSVVRPAYPMPFAGLTQAMNWSRERGEAKQRELIGMTAEAEINLSFLTSYGTKITTARVAPHAFDTEDT